MKKIALVWLSALLSLAAGSLPLHAAEEGEQAALNERIQDLKKEVLDLNRDLFLLEEDLLFPANTQFSVFLSMDAGKLFQLDSVKLKIDDKLVAAHLYTEREVAALRRGGVQRLYVGNLASGKHEIVAFFTGKGPQGRAYKRATTVVIDKSEDPQFIELKILDDATKEQPQFVAKVWE